MSVVKSKKKAIRNLAQSKVVDIGDYRDLQGSQESQKIAFISSDQDLFTSFVESLPKNIESERFDSRFDFEKTMKSKDWDALILDERSLKDEALNLCEKLKRQQMMDELVVFILSEDTTKEKVRSGLEKGADEWVSGEQSASSLIRLLDHHLNL